MGRGGEDVIAILQLSPKFPLEKSQENDFTIAASRERVSTPSVPPIPWGLGSDGNRAVDREEMLQRHNTLES